MDINLSRKNELFIQSQVSMGNFSSPTEAVAPRVDLLRKRGAIVSRIRETRGQLDSGMFTDYDEASLAQRFEDLKQVKTR